MDFRSSAAELVREKFHPACLWRSESSDFRSSAAELIRDKFHPACPASAITCVRQVLVLHIGKPV
jgi:hypothetical protein